MTFSVDKKKVSEGDIVEVKWDCPSADLVKIIIDNGFKSASVEVEKSGTKKYKLNRSKGETLILLECTEKGKTIKKHINIRVRPPKVYKAKTKKQYDHYKRMDRRPIQEKWNQLKSRFKYFWQVLPPQKKQAYILLLILLVVMIVSSFYPQAVFFGMSVLTLYLLWTLLKK